MSIAVTTVILFVVFGVLLFLGVPISVSIIASSIVTAMSTLSWDQITFITMQKMNSGVESFSLLAVPLFILAGNIMNNGGIAKRLINFAQIFVGKIPGNLAQANILANMLFGALSGSSVAAFPVLVLQRQLQSVELCSRWKKSRSMILLMRQQLT